MSASGKRHMGRVAQLGEEHGCIVCGGTFAHVHHMIDGRTPGRREDDWLTMPLCYQCHEGAHGIHGTKQRFTLRKTSENKALAKTLEMIYGETKSNSINDRSALERWVQSCAESRDMESICEEEERPF
jgi:hypothetical protein